jgi:hypothetical protein
MKNLTFDDVRSLTKNNLLKELVVLYPFQAEKEFDSKRWVLFCFSVENMFSFSVYAPQDVPADEINELRVHLYESHGRNKTFGLLYPKNDQRFVGVDWTEFFQKDPRSAAIVSPDVLLEMMKFTARLSRMKVFQ